MPIAGCALAPNTGHHRLSITTFMDLARVAIGPETALEVRESLQQFYGQQTVIALKDGRFSKSPNVLECQDGRTAWAAKLVNRQVSNLSLNVSRDAL